MKKYNKKEIMEIVNETQKEIAEDLLKINKDMDIADEKQFLNNLMNMKDMALLTAFAISIEDKLKD